MEERVSSEHPSVRTFRASVERSGATSRPRIALPEPAADHVPRGVARLDLGGTQYYADVRAGGVGSGPIVHGAYDNARLARSPGEGENRLPGWLEAVDLDIGRSALFDVIVPDFLFGLRPPGSTAIYEAVEPPPSSLSNIAAELDG